jgi:omega-6 fatty acid desaturase (delta-12 desaturase)
MSNQEKIFGHIKKYAKSDNLRAFQYLVITLTGYTGGFFLPTWCIPLHTLFLIRLFMCFHDMGHGFFFKTRFLNLLFGTLCGTLTATSFDQWNTTHNEHHKISNDLVHTQYAQTAVFTVSEYRKLSPVYQFLYRKVSGNRLAILTVVPIYLSFVNPLIRAKNNHEKALFISFLYFLFKVNLLQHFYSCVLLGNLGGFILFHTQHTFDSAKRRKDMSHFDSALEGASFLQVPWYLKWASAGIEYHHIHHLSVAVPLYNLQSCHEEAPNDMFKSVKRITIWEGLESLKYTLYDEEKDRLISFEELLPAHIEMIG